ncbi:MAG: hypothetical protein DMD64_13305 [Gemmatimonadetes bacterium]|nr:MAG: hypothetical protein DMD64_13305 [Gemmatimonadota bacterium]
MLALETRNRPRAAAPCRTAEVASARCGELFGQRRGSGFFQRVLGICHGCGFTPRVLEAMEHMHTLLYMVGAGYGVSLVPATLTPADRPEVALVPLRESAATLELGMIWRFDQKSPLVLGFLDAVRTWCKEMPNGRP